MTTTTGLDATSVADFAAGVAERADEIRAAAILQGFLRDAGGEGELPIHQRPVGNILVTLISIFDGEPLMTSTPSQVLPLLRALITRVPELRALFAALAPEGVEVASPVEVPKLQEEPVSVEDVLAPKEDTGAKTKAAKKSPPRVAPAPKETKKASPEPREYGKRPRNDGLPENAILCLQALARTYTSEDLFDRRGLLDSVKTVHGREWTNGHLSFVPTLVEQGLLIKIPKKLPNGEESKRCNYSLSPGAIQSYG